MSLSVTQTAFSRTVFVFPVMIAYYLWAIVADIMSHFDVFAKECEREHVLFTCPHFVIMSP